jgi:hypothetical protein
MPRTQVSRIIGISAAWRNASDAHRLYVPVAHPDSANFDKAQVSAWLKALFASSTRLVFHNAIYDLGWIKTEFGIDPPPAERLHDTNEFSAPPPSANVPALIVSVPFEPPGPASVSVPLSETVAPLSFKSSAYAVGVALLLMLIV